MANYLELLESSARERQSIVCFGLDPVLEMMPESLMQPREEKIVYFYTQIIDAALVKSPSISAMTRRSFSRRSNENSEMA